MTETIEEHGGYDIVPEPAYRKPDGKRFTVERGARFYVQCALCFYDGKPGLTIGSAPTREGAERIGLEHVQARHPSL